MHNEEALRPSDASTDFVAQTHDGIEEAARHGRPARTHALALTAPAILARDYEVNQSIIRDEARNSPLGWACLYSLGRAVRSWPISRSGPGSTAKQRWPGWLASI
jgi:hypothetical protein